MDANGFLWELCKENLEFCRHHELQREAVARLIVIVASVLLGVVALDNTLNTLDIPIGLFIMLLGIFGAIFSNKHYERFNYHYERFRVLRKELQSRLEVQADVIQREADNIHLQKWPTLSQISPNNFWRGLHICVSITGGVIILAALTGF